MAYAVDGMMSIDILADEKTHFSDGIWRDLEHVFFHFPEFAGRKGRKSPKETLGRTVIPENIIAKIFACQ